MRHCRDCNNPVSDQAVICPRCGAPYPAREQWDGWGWEYRSPIRVLGLPLIHIAFKYRPNRRPVVARGVLAIGQFATGIVTVSQFGLGVVSLSQFTIAGLAVAQFAAAYACVAQFGVYLHHGTGQMVIAIGRLFGGT